MAFVSNVPKQGIPTPSSHTAILSPRGRLFGSGVESLDQMPYVGGFPGAVPIGMANVWK